MRRPGIDPRCWPGSRAKAKRQGRRPWEAAHTSDISTDTALRDDDETVPERAPQNARRAAARRVAEAPVRDTR